MRFLFLKRSLSWPRAAGHDVHTYHMIQALAALGHEAELALVEAPSAEAVAGIRGFVGRVGSSRPAVGLGTRAAGLADSTRPTKGPIRLTCLQRRYFRYWGIEPNWLDATSALVAEQRPDVVVSASFDVLPCLAAASGTTRVWYAADEYARHHLSMVRPGQPTTWRHLFEAAVAGLYERAYSAHVDRAWVVSGEERRALRFVTGIRDVDVVPNGVDADYFRPGGEPQTPRSCTFWGRLDAGPNIQAVTWFCRRVWPAVRREFPDARFTIYGFHPLPGVRSLAGDGVSIVADIPDIRPAVRAHEVVVLPLVSGGGIKNKLLEAAALGLPIVASPPARGGLDRGAPLITARSPSDWIRALRELWGHADRRRLLGAELRSWVLAAHTWEAAARAALTPLAPSPPRRDGSAGELMGLTTPGSDEKRVAEAAPP